MTPGLGDRASSMSSGSPSPTGVTRRPLRLLLMAAGTLSVALAILGIFLPLLPTTPLLLLAAWCYARSSERLYRRLLANRWLGPYIRNYRDGRGMTTRAKVSTLAALWLAIGVTVAFVESMWWLQLLLLAIAAGVSIFLLRLPTCKREVTE